MYNPMVNLKNKFLQEDKTNNMKKKKALTTFIAAFVIHMNTDIRNVTHIKVIIVHMKTEASQIN